MEENKDFDNWYRTRITENLTEPPADAWENIADELDTLEVWDRISAELDTPTGWFAHKTLHYALLIAVLLFLSGGLFYYKYNITAPAPITPTVLAMEDETTAGPDVLKDIPAQDNKTEKAARDQPVSRQPSQKSLRNDNGKAIASADVDVRSGHREKETETSKETGVPDEKQAKQTSATDETLGADNNRPDHDLIASADRKNQRDSAETTHHSNGDTHTVKTSDVLTAITNHPEPPAEYAYVTVVSLIVPDSMLTIYPLEAVIVPVSLEDVEENPGDEKPLYQKSIEFGVTASGKNTWLLNRTTLMGLEKHTLTTTLPDFGKDVGMVVTYHFSPRWSAQAEGLFLSELGQRYQEYRNGNYVDREVDLRYYTMNLVLKYNRNSFAGIEPASGHALLGGIFAGKLNRATETTDDNTIDNADGYTQFNYGLLAGYEYNRYIFKNLVFTTGLRVNYGFPNIDALRYSRTATGSFDVNVALKYRLGL